MTWQYTQKTGELTHEGVFEGTGYSGASIARNDTGEESIRDIGPIPRGRYTIDAAIDMPRLGPCVMHLTPFQDTETFGRSGFFIHGDDARHDASHGCIILGPAIRQKISGSDDRILDVI